MFSPLPPQPCGDLFSTLIDETAFSSVAGVRESLRGSPGRKEKGNGARGAGRLEVPGACSGVMNLQRISTFGEDSTCRIPSVVVDSDFNILHKICYPRTPTHPS